MLRNLKLFGVVLLSTINAGVWLGAQNVAINETGEAADASAILDVSSTTKGLLAPRMTEAERDAIADPAIGLTIFQTDGMAGYYFFDGLGWSPLSSSGGSGHWSLSGSDIYNSNAGNVGIGVSMPETKLHLLQDSEAMRIQGNESYVSFYNGDGIYRGFVWQGPGDNMSMGTGSGNATGRVEVYNNGLINMTVAQNGLMSIRGGTPSIKLELDDTTPIAEFYKSGDDLEIVAQRALLGFGGTPTDLILQTDVGGFFPLIAGRVGIGTRTPFAKLHLKSNNEMFRMEGAGYTYLSFYNGINYKGFLLSDGNNMGLGTSVENNTGSVWFYAGGAIRMLMLPNGNIGIGTESPTHKLAVNGTIRTKEVIVDTGWSDYVFEKGYALRSLKEVEAHIAVHGHLPGIPSATEIVQNGLPVGDAQRLMMEKIEELTLYVIALQKEIDNLKLCSESTR